MVTGLARACARGFIALVLVLAVSATIYDDDFQLDTNMVWVRQESLWAAGSILPSPPGNGRSEVQFHYELSVSLGGSDSEENGHAWFIVYNIKDSNLIGFLDQGAADTTRRFCCTPDLYGKAPSEVCNPDKMNDVMIQPTHDGRIMAEKITLRPRGQVFHFDGDQAVYKVRESGIHVAMTLSCDTKAEAYTFKGKNVWVNPYGYLPGRQYAYLPFYAVLSVVYVGVALVWALASMCHWRELLQIQIYITILVFIGMAEMFSWTTHYSSWNIVGEWSGFLMFCSLVSSAGKRTMSRVLVLMVSMGWGTVKPFLQVGTKRKIAFVAVLYFIATTGFDLLVKSGFNYYVHVWEVVQIMFIFPVALLDSIFYWWIFVELSGTIEHLESRRQTIKLELYRRFQRVLILSIVASALSITAHMYSSTAMDQMELWDTVWVFDAFWEALYFVVMLAIMFLWRPNKNSQAYAYSEQVNADQEDADAIEMDDQETGEVRTGGAAASGDAKQGGLGYSFKVHDDSDEEGKLD